MVLFTAKGVFPVDIPTLREHTGERQYHGTHFLFLYDIPRGRERLVAARYGIYLEKIKIQFS
jgi:hypothetical protein